MGTKKSIIPIGIGSILFIFLNFDPFGLFLYKYIIAHQINKYYIWVKNSFLILIWGYTKWYDILYYKK